MTIAIAYLGPAGTYTEAAASAYAEWLRARNGAEPMLCPCPSIAQALHTLARRDVSRTVVPIENSTQGSVTATLDTLWQLEGLQIQHALVLPIAHALLSQATAVVEIRTVYSHSQAFAQCQRWLERELPDAHLVATDSTTEAVARLADNPTAAAIASPRSAALYEIPILARNVNDYPDNCTRFWVLGREETTHGSHVSLAYSLPDEAGVLARALAVLAERRINLSRIESRPTKRLLGEYVFFVDLEGSLDDPVMQAAIVELRKRTRELKVFGCYELLPVALATWGAPAESGMGPTLMPE